ncbi:MAG: hypothetical protein AB1631_17840 [Acidobacteriota bacterium]
MIKKSPLLFLMIALISNIAPAQTQNAQASAEKVATLLDKSGYSFRKTSNNLWVVSFTGKQIADVQVIITSAPDLLLAGVTIARKNRMRPTAEFFYKLLKLAHSYDLVKVGLDTDDDLFVRVELRMRTMDVDEFKSYIKQTAAAADEIYGQIKPFLSAQ